MRPNMTPLVLVFFSLMDMVRPQVKVGHRNIRATSKWKELYQRFLTALMAWVGNLSCGGG